MKKMLNNFLIAVQFLTRLPLKFDLDWQDKKVAKSLLWYPLVGTLIGLMLILFAGLFSTQQAMLCAALTLSFWVLISGGLHLDGLADSADAWLGSHGNKQRALEIMKDPQAGPIAVIVLVLLLLIKFSALYSLINTDKFFLLLIVPALARSAPLLLFLTTAYVREKGLGRAMSVHFPRRESVFILILTALCVFFLSGLINGLLLIIISISVLYGLRYLMMKLIGGITGDTIGASIEIIEMIVLCVLVLI